MRTFFLPSTYRLAALLLNLLFLATPASALVPTQTTNLVGQVDGATVGDLDGDGVMEIAVVTRGGSYGATGNTLGIGSLAVLNADFTLRWQVQTGKELAGFPTMGDFNGDGALDIAVCELDAAAMCYVYNGLGVLMWSAGPFYYAGMANSGPTAADINGDGADDLFVLSWGGEVAALDGPTGLDLWPARFNAWTTNGDLLFGHTSIGDVNGDGKLELVFGGYRQGGLYVLDAATGTLLWSKNLTTFNGWGGYFHSSGPALMDLDGDPSSLEIVLGVGGATPRVAAFGGSTGTLLWSRVIAGGLAFISPVAADIDGDLALEITVQSRNGTLHIIGFDGTLENSVFVGANPWIAPAFLDWNQDAIPEILAASQAGLVVLDGTTLATLDSYTAPAVGVYPSPVIADLQGDLQTEILTGTFRNKSYSMFQIAVRDAQPWKSFAANATHPGRIDPRPGGASNIPQGLDSLRNAFTSLATAPGTPPAATNLLLNEIIPELNAGFQDLLKGKPHEIAEVGINIVALLQQITLDTGLNTLALQEDIAALAIRTLQQHIARATAVLGPTDPAVLQAETLLAQAQAAFAVGDFLAANIAAEDGSKPIKNPPVNGNFCVGSSTEPYLGYLCEFLLLRDDVVAAIAAGNTDPNLATALDKLNKAGSALSMADVRTATKEMRKAGEALMLAGDATTTQSLADLSGRLVRQFLDDAGLYGLIPADLALAEPLWTAGQADLAGGALISALINFEDAASTARP